MDTASMRDWAEMTILHGDHYNTSKNFKIPGMIFKAKIAYRYCKSETIAVCKGISILIIHLKRTNCNSRNEAAYYLVAELGFNAR